MTGYNPFPFSRRRFLQGIGLIAASGLPNISLAANPTDRKLHGLSSFGELKYPENFSHFEFANPNAPKGGLFVFNPSNWGMNQNVQTYNTFNSFVLKGAAPPRMELCFDSLMVRAIDEPDAVYCSTAKHVTISEDRNEYVFDLREEARFHDGSPVRAEDVAFSYKIIKEKGHPQLAQDMRNLVSVTNTGSHQVTFTFNGKQSDRVILNLAVNVPILSSTYYATREFDSSTLEPPLSSGIYKVGKYSAGQFIEYERIKDHWAKDMPFSIGLNNFDRLRIEFYSERTAAFEAFKKGDIMWREEFTSKTWATEYDFPAVKDGKVVQKLFPEELVPSMQGWALNVRREKFRDVRVRRAINLCFDFEWTNRNLFYGAYTRSDSMFEKSPFKASGKPEQAEIDLLNSLDMEVNKLAFEDVVTQPVSNGSGNDRKNLREAFSLFKAAGWRSKERKLVDQQGNQFTMEFLIRSKTFERILGGFTENLRRLGIAVSIRLVDPSQYQSRIDEFNFDIVMSALRFSANPTSEGIRRFLHSETVDVRGSQNLPGVAIPAIDALIDRISSVKSREELTIVMRCIDRVLRAHQIWIPNWYSENHRVAMWDRFGWSEPKPDYQFPVEVLWWTDEEKVKRLENS